MNTPQFKEGTTPGEAAWLIARCVQALSPIAPALFGKAGLTGQVQIDTGAWMANACAMALQIQQQAFSMTGVMDGGELVTRAVAGAGKAPEGH